MIERWCLVTVWAAESRDDVASGDAQHVSEVVVPYGGACGLSSLGVQQGPLVMRLALRKDARSRCEAEDLATDFVNAREQGEGHGQRLHHVQGLPGRSLKKSVERRETRGDHATLRGARTPPDLVARVPEQGVGTAVARR